MIRGHVHTSEPYTLLLTIKAAKPVQLQVYGYDTVIRNCVYFDRLKSNQADGTFYGTETLEFPLPILPKKLEVIARDASTKSANGIEILDYQVVPLKSKFKASSALIQDFDEFTDWLAQHAGTLPCGTYHSTKGWWTIHVVDVIVVEEKGKYVEVDTPASVSHINGEMYGRKADLQKLTVPNIKTMFAHELNHYINDDYTEQGSDRFAEMYCLAKGFSKWDIFDTGARLFGNCDPNKENCTEREQRVKEMYQRLQQA